MRCKLLAILLALAAIWSLAVSCEARGDDLQDAWKLATSKNKPMKVFVGQDAEMVPGHISVSVEIYQGDKTPRVVDVDFPIYTPEWIKAQKVPCVVFVGCPPRKIAGCAVAQAYALPGFDSSVPFVIVWPMEGSGWKFPADAEDWRLLLRAFPERQVSQSASFFTSNGKRRAANVDVELVRSVWPAGVFMPDNLEVYQPARLVQRTGNRSGNGAHFIEHRSVLEEKWSVPGGLVGIQGWRSVLLRGRDNQYQSKRVRANPYEHLGEIVYAKIYGNAVFYDLLLNDEGKPFELRQAEKKDGTWQRFVLWKDRSARPVGYHPFASSKSCAECHSESGGGGYNNARKPGWDTVLSEPLDGVETNGPVIDDFSYQPFNSGGVSMRRRR